MIPSIIAALILICAFVMMAALCGYRPKWSKQKKLKWYKVRFHNYEFFLQAYGVGNAKHEAWRSFKRQGNRISLDEFSTVARAWRG